MHSLSLNFRAVNSSLLCSKFSNWSSISGVKKRCLGFLFKSLIVWNTLNLARKCWILRAFVYIFSSSSLLWIASIVYPRSVKIIILFLVATFKRGIFSVHKSRESISRGGSASRVGSPDSQTSHLSRSYFLWVDCASSQDEECRVLASEKALRASWTSHESTRHSWNIASECDVAFERYCIWVLCISAKQSTYRMQPPICI